MRTGRGWLALRRREFPVLVGAAEALAAGAVLLVAAGFAGRAAVVPAWGLIVWAALSGGRALRYQVAAAVALGMMLDLGAGTGLGAGAGMLGGGLLAANLAVPRAERWNAGHVLFLLAAIAGGWIATLAFGFLGANGFHGRPSAATMVATLAVLVPLLAGGFALGRLFDAINARHREPINLTRFDR